METERNSQRRYYCPGLFERREAVWVNCQPPRCCECRAIKSRQPAVGAHSVRGVETEASFSITLFFVSGSTSHMLGRNEELNA